MRRWPGPSTQLALAVAVGVLGSCAGILPNSITGVVRDDAGPVPGATVRLQGTDRSTLTDERGRFILTVDEVARVSAWAAGYLIGGGEEHAPGARISIDLTRAPEHDNPGYAWVSAMGATSDDDPKPCVTCHSSRATELPMSLPADQWLVDAHSGSATNPRFLSMYSGTDLDGNRSPVTSYTHSGEYGRIPLRPDASRPYYGPGYKLDFPNTAGNCGACHVPAAAIDSPHSIDPRLVEGVGAEGVTCDFCHKISGVRLDPTTGLPEPGMPGVLAYEYTRPPDGRQFFAGPFDDVAPGEDTFLSLYAESAYCAGCHRGTFWNVVVYDSFGEWLASPYSDPVSGMTCQDCHMPTTGASLFALPEKGGISRDPAAIPGHLMPGARDEELLRSAVTMTIDAVRVAGRIDVVVDLWNSGAGHSVPTDSPLRHLLLIVIATQDGHALNQVFGPVVPDWGGVGGPADGYYAGLPGTAYAKVLEELWTGVAPTGAYWNQTRILSDNRIPAMARDTTRYSFEVSGTGEVQVTVRLVFRRAFIGLMDQKGWDEPDIVMAEEAVTIDKEG